MASSETLVSFGHVTSLGRVNFSLTWFNLFVAQLVCNLRLRAPSISSGVMEVKDVQEVQVGVCENGCVAGSMIFAD